MPNTTAAKKALRQNQKRREKNLKRKKEIKDGIKKYRKLLGEGKKDKAKKLLPKLYKTLDKFAKTSFMKENKAKRLKSRLSKKLNKPKPSQ